MGGECRGPWQGRCRWREEERKFENRNWEPGRAKTRPHHGYQGGENPEKWHELLDEGQGAVQEEAIGSRLGGRTGLSSGHARSEKSRAGHGRSGSALCGATAIRNVTRIKEACREAWSIVSLETSWHDLRYGARTLAKNPGFTWWCFREGPQKSRFGRWHSCLGRLCRVDSGEYTAPMRGRLKARYDVWRGHYAVLAYGLPPPWCPQYAHLLRERYGIEVRTIALCIVSETLRSYADSYDEVSAAAASHKFGHDVFKECAEVARSQWEQR